MKRRRYLALIIVALGVAPIPSYLHSPQIQGVTTDHLGTVASAVALQETPYPVLADEEIVAEIQSLYARWSASYSAAGWLHLIEQHHRNLEGLGSLPNGVPIPANFMKQAWYLIGNDGNVVRAISIMLDLGGQTIQETIFVDGEWHNLTTGDRISTSPYALRLDFGFTENAQIGPPWYSSIRRTLLSQDGKAVLEYALREDEAAPVLLAGVREPVSSIETRATIAPDTGELLSLLIVGEGTDGSELLISSVKYLVLERSEPPVDLLVRFDMTGN